MASIVLRVSGESLDIDACLARLPMLQPEDCYRVGEAVRSRPPYRQSGFVLTLADDDDESAALELTQRRLTSIAAQLTALLEDGVVGELDCGIFVMARAPHSIMLPPSFLRCVAEAGINLRITAYPCSNDEP